MTEPAPRVPSKPLERKHARAILWRVVLTLGIVALVIGVVGAIAVQQAMRKYFAYEFVVVNDFAEPLRDVRLIACQNDEVLYVIDEVAELAPGASFEVDYDPTPWFDLRIEFTGPGGTETWDTGLYVDTDEGGVRAFSLHPELETR